MAGELLGKPLRSLVIEGIAINGERVEKNEACIIAKIKGIDETGRPYEDQ